MPKYKAIVPMPTNNHYPMPKKLADGMLGKAADLTFQGKIVGKATVAKVFWVNPTDVSFEMNIETNRPLTVVEKDHMNAVSIDE